MSTLKFTFAWMTLLLLPIVDGETINGTTNLTRRPSLKFNEGLAIANKALGSDAKSYVCTIARSKKRSSGGGWALQFRSRTLPCKWVRVDKSGKVISVYEPAGDGAKFEASPRPSIERAIEIALATREKPRRWHAVHARWVQEEDEWFLVVVNLHRDSFHAVVDSRGKVREVKQ